MQREPYLQGKSKRFSFKYILPSEGGERLGVHDRVREALVEGKIGACCVHEAVDEREILQCLRREGVVHEQEEFLAWKAGGERFYVSDAELEG